MDSGGPRGAVERPRDRGLRLLGRHMLAALAYESTYQALLALLPFLARLQFGAGDWGTLLFTVAIPTFQISSVLWNALLPRLGLGRYLALHWTLCPLPCALMALADNYWTLLLLHVIAASGAAGWYPVKGLLLQRLYSDAVRGKAMASVNVVMLLATAGLAFTFGSWLDHSGTAFRIFLPACALAQGAGLFLFVRLARHGRDSDVVAPSPALPSAWLEPFRQMHRVLSHDRVFARFQIAFMTYGAGYMICEALLPIFADVKLHMKYGELAASTRVSWLNATVLMALPMGWLMDRAGAERTLAVSYVLLAGYPLVLTFAAAPQDVALASVFFGVAMAGVQQGWMLGPVMLAPSPRDVALYVAIHSTLVGLRGPAFQFLGLVLYQLTQDFRFAFVTAAACHLAAAWLMWRLYCARRASPPDSDIQSQGTSGR